MSLDIMNDNFGGEIRHNQGQDYSRTNSVRCGDEGFGERHCDDVLVDDPFDRADITVHSFTPAEGDPALSGL